LQPVQFEAFQDSLSGPFSGPFKTFLVSILRKPQILHWSFTLIQFSMLIDSSKLDVL